MTDRELLELAAKAAGMTIHAANQAQRDACGAGDVGLWISNDKTCWNPLVDDGDALRLAVKLGIALDFFYSGPMDAPTYSFTRARRFTVEETDGLPDSFSATRRAIVRAAAEIGRQMP